ncbi:hypothetical protein IGB42_01663 [Andreprevotia sp. IGB-42]|uniref:flavodoxin family protein n=1 Tax=Andreprevotia sp. IGB-42 TaxID=2497473 RepID=UPI00135B597E|nr:NAD(P)H-dependent oxidoreductase [Andreprevotia sp. IGB-42]KAF0813984.1 hypothetical protein IGB42_01663 [Andreprevotia sp. IGB-42]
MEPAAQPPSLEPVTGQAPGDVSRITFHQRFGAQFSDPLFAPEQAALERLEAIAWEAYKAGRKAPRTQKAGAGYADPDYDLSIDWINIRRQLDDAARTQQDPATQSRVLVICASARNDGTCPGEVSKTWRMTQQISTLLSAAGITVDLLDLSLLTSEYGRKIYPCKACVSTAMPLCHWPCSCYPNHALNQADDWMNEIYARWVAAHGVIIVTPVYWYQAPSPLKLMIDRLVCADGGNPDPTSTHGKSAVKAKEIELAGWDYPKHLAGRAYGVVVHGDVAGIEGVRRGLCDWLDWMGLIDAGNSAQLDRYIGYYKPYATSHAEFDADEDVQEEVRNVARAVASTVARIRKGELIPPDAALQRPRPK